MANKIKYKHTLADLQTMQAWPLDRKIQVTQTRIFEWYMRWSGDVFVSVSGGKDSAVLLDIARRCYPDIEAVYVDTGLDYPEVKAMAKGYKNVTILRPEMRFDEVIGTHGFVYPSKDVARTIRYARKGSVWANARLAGTNDDGTPSKYRQSHYVRWAFLRDAPFRISDECCNVMKERPLNQYAKKSGKMAIMGIMATESRRRKEAWLRSGCNNFDGAKRHISKPMAFWKEQDVLEYVRRYKIGIASVYGDIVADKEGNLCTTGEQRTGCVFCPIGCHLDKESRFLRLAKTHPKLYDYCMNGLGLVEFLGYLEIKLNKKLK